MFGFLNIYKPKGKTSHDVVAILRRVTKIKQIGHTGTLDPFAEGVLPVCIGKATRLIEYLADDKAYIGTVQLGKSTTTYDIEGDAVKVSDKEVSIEEIEKALQSFRGEVEQFPPIYSAIKVNGKKLYEYARKGEEVEIKPRKVTIKNLKILNYDSKNRVLELYIECSKGTYIRSIANDLGEALGVYGHLTKLVRVKAGEFEIKDCIRLEDLETKEDAEKVLINPLEKLHYPKYELGEEEKNKVLNGMEIFSPQDYEGIVILVYSNNILAIGEAFGRRIKCVKVFGISSV